MKIAVIATIRDYAWGAPGLCMGRLVEELVSANHHVLWFVAPIDLNEAIVGSMSSRGVKVVPLPDAPPHFVRCSTLRRAAWYWRRGAPSIERVLRDFDAEHVFVNQGGTWDATQPQFFNALSDFRGRYTLICHLNQPRPAFAARELERARQLVGGAARVFFNSQWSRHLAEIQIAAKIVNAAQFQLPLRFDVSSPLPWPRASEPHLALVCRLDAFHKGIDLALEAVAVLKREGIPLRLRVYGQGRDEEYLRLLSEFFGIDESVEFRGYQECIEEIWRENEMLLLPSRFEGLAVSMIEAMAYGRPVLRTPHGGADEWVEDGVDGYLCDGAEIGALCSALRRAVAQRGQWQKMGVAANSRVRRELSRRPALIFLSALDGSPEQVTDDSRRVGH